jgi:hypothetical protein
VRGTWGRKLREVRDIHDPARESTITTRRKSRVIGASQTPHCRWGQDLRSLRSNHQVAGICAGTLTDRDEDPFGVCETAAPRLGDSDRSEQTAVLDRRVTRAERVTRTRRFRRVAVLSAITGSAVRTVPTVVSAMDALFRPTAALSGLALVRLGITPTPVSTWLVPGLIGIALAPETDLNAATGPTRVEPAFVEAQL